MSDGARMCGSVSGSCAEATTFALSVSAGRVRKAITAWLPGAQPYVAPILLMPVVLGAAITVTMLMHVATKWAFYGRGTQAQYRKYSWSFQARGRGPAPVLLLWLAW